MICGTSFDTTVTRLPKHYKGSDAKAIYLNLLQTVRSLQKNEFETQQEYQARIEKVKRSLNEGIAHQHFAGTYELPNSKNMRVPPLDTSTTVSYDAETKKLTVHYTKGKYSSGDKRVLRSKYEGSTSHYIGSNAFGASVRVERTVSTSYCFQMKDIRLDDDVVFVANLDPKKAKAVSDKLALLFVFNVEDPYIDKDDYESRQAKFDNPYEESHTIHNIAVKPTEAWLFNYETGEILAKNKSLNPLKAEALRAKELRERKLTREEARQIAKAQAEQKCKKLNALVTKTESIEADLADICTIGLQISALDYKTAPNREKILAKYKAEADTVDGWKQTEFESLNDFKARTQSEKEKLEVSKQKELSQLEAEANVLREQVERLSKKEYILDGSQIHIELGKYDIDRELFPVVMKNEPSTTVTVEIVSIIRMTPQRAKSFKADLESNQVRPQLHAKVNGEILKSEIVNVAQNYTLECQKGEFLTAAEHAKIEHDRIIYTDPTTGLMWTKDANIIGKEVSLYEASRWASNLKYGGYTDWRLPTKAEFASFANRRWGYSRTWFGANGFTNYECVLYWSARNGNYDGGWNIQEGSNVLEYDESVRRGPLCAWPVRDGR